MNRDPLPPVRQIDARANAVQPAGRDRRPNDLHLLAPVHLGGVDDDRVPDGSRCPTRRPTYSLIETAKANGLEPYAYLRHVIGKIADAGTEEALSVLLVWNTS